MMTGEFTPVSNKETWSDLLEFFDDETGDAWFEQSSPPDDITVRLRDPGTKSQVLSLSLSGGGVTITGDGLAAFVASTSTMGGICAQTYELGILYTDSNTITQVFLGTINVMDGL